MKVFRLPDQNGAFWKFRDPFHSVLFTVFVDRVLEKLNKENQSRGDNTDSIVRFSTNLIPLDSSPLSPSWSKLTLSR